MSKLTVMLIPDDAHSTRQFALPRWLLRATALVSLFLAIGSGYLIFDYLELRQMRQSYHQLSAENEGLKGEARILMNNLSEVKRSLNRVQDYTNKLNELTKIRVRHVSKKTGIGPLSPEEYKLAKDAQVESTSDYFPLGVNMDKLIFRPVFDRLEGIGRRSQRQAIELQRILSNLSKQKSLLSSIPAISPVNGWVTSGFGYRTSPFTGKRTMHKGIDVASPIGSPIYSPANGVVIFTGSKAGFGNFIMIAHGYGIVSRYGHNAQNMVQPGQRVKRGEQIATVGMSGRTTGPHLHYEVLVNGRHVNPKKFILDLNDNPLAVH